MNISELSIKRPVLATVIVLVIVLFGMIGYVIWVYVSIPV
jgi:multidrug efflux pump